MKENKKIVDLDIKETGLLSHNKKIMDILLLDRTTGKNIRWGTDNYSGNGERFQAEKEIKASLITGWYDGFIRPRVDKDSETQLERTRNKAEVFTPSWIIKKQLDSVLEEMEDLSFEDFINTRWLEIACGEAPYMTNRYDMVTGESIGLEKRAGFIDEKFRRLNKKISKRKEWIDLAILIYKSSYGYEFQGDSLILARENLLLTFVDNYFYMFGEFPDNKLLIKLADIISKNVFQMDGLTYQVPYSEVKAEVRQLSMFEEVFEEEAEPILAEVKLWNLNKLMNFKNIAEESEIEMKFDVVIGNPPYQINDNGEREEDASKNASASPVYNYFVNQGIKISNIQSFIIPARWLFGAGKGLKSFTEKMMKEKKFQSLIYYENGKKIFPNTMIKGGVCILTRNDKYSGSAKLELNIKNEIIKRQDFINTAGLGMLVIANEMSSLLSKIVGFEEGFVSITNILSGRNPYGLPTSFFINPNKFGVSLINEVNKNNDITVIGLDRSQNRITKYIDRSVKLKKGEETVDTWKVFSPYAYGEGVFGEAISNPFVAGPGIICTETFLRFGRFENEIEANNLLSYLKTKFLRALVSVLKVTQHSTTAFKYVPLQDFTLNSDIDWSKSIPEIDQQLYKKYGLSQEEIDFIEKNVQEMK